MRRKRRDTRLSAESGAAFVEAALLIALVSLAAVASLQEMGRLVRLVSCQYVHRTKDVGGYFVKRDGEWRCLSPGRFATPYF